MKLGADSGGGEVDGTPAGLGAWGWRLGLSLLGAALWAFPMLLRGLEVLLGLLLWGLAWRGPFRRGWLHHLAALACFPGVLLLAYGVLYGAHRGAQDYRRGRAYLLERPDPEAPLGRRLLVDPVTRVPLDEVSGWRCGNGVQPLFRDRQSYPGYAPVVRRLHRWFGPMETAYLGPLPEAAEVLDRLRLEGALRTRAELRVELARLRETAPAWHQDALPREPHDPAVQALRTRAREGGYLLALEDPRAPPATRAAGPWRGEFRVPLRVWLIDARSRRVVARYAFSP